MEEEQAHSHLTEFWEGRWKSGETPWDHGHAAPPFAEFLRREGPPTGRVLIPGPGSGHDVRFFAEAGADVTGLDISESAVALASQRNRHPRAHYRVGSILQPDEDLLGTFDWVIEHTCLCAMDPRHWSAYAAAVSGLLRPGGYYLAIFYRNPHDEEGPPHGITTGQSNCLFSPSFELLRSWVPKQAYDSRVGREELCWYRLKEDSGGS